ncbi:hypothetical protein SBA4_1210050 [Candidatus Sulfopaludibacter sp. SbA4]|nr:hypothetical protein SBA4_1210050 [Candidatus Sulfopaludibacter sp. SbA4]
MIGGNNCMWSRSICREAQVSGRSALALNLPINQAKSKEIDLAYETFPEHRVDSLRRLYRVCPGAKPPGG